MQCVRSASFLVLVNGDPNGPIIPSIGLRQEGSMSPYLFLLYHTLMVFDFHKRMIQLIMQCVRLASFSVLVNGDPNGPIIPSRGLRQGGSLSPYLFLLCTKGLVSLLKNSDINNDLRGIKVCRHAPSVNHLLFTDDSLIFYKTNSFSSHQLLDILQKYVVALGQCINTDETTMTFNWNVRESLREHRLCLCVAQEILKNMRNT